jgi:hypothetical protein
MKKIFRIYQKIFRIYHIFPGNEKNFPENNINSSFQKCPLPGKKRQSLRHFLRKRRALCSRKKGTWQNLGGGLPSPPVPTLLRLLNKEKKIEKAGYFRSNYPEFVASTSQIVLASLNNSSNNQINNIFVKPSKFPITYIVFSNHKPVLSVKIHKMFDLIQRDSSFIESSRFRITHSAVNHWLIRIALLLSRVRDSYQPMTAECNSNSRALNGISRGMSCHAA